MKQEADLADIGCPQAKDVCPVGRLKGAPARGQVSDALGESQDLARLILYRRRNRRLAQCGKSRFVRKRTGFWQRAQIDDRDSAVSVLARYGQQDVIGTVADQSVEIFG
jgi:hypothetical protein